MEEYPEELRTPPVALVSLVGCPELHPTISSFLHSEQPPINSMALPDFSKISVLARKQRDPLAAAKPVAGILKRDWLSKHLTRVPAAVAALFRSDQVTGDPAQWLQVCTDLDNLKAVIHGRRIRFIVVLVQTTSRDDISEDLMVALRKRAEIDSKYFLVLVQNDESELMQSLNRLAGIFAELCNTYYREEGRKIKNQIEKKNITSVELNIRYYFKVAAYAEFRRDWAEALRFYEDAYRALREMIGISTRLPPVQRLVEIKALAEQLHFKISTLLLHGGKVIEAITSFQRHIVSYERVVGEPAVAFLHWEWFSRQFLVFAELLETSSATMPANVSSAFGTSDNHLTEWEFQPAYYYQLSAHYLMEKRICLDYSLSMIEGSELANMIDGGSESVIPSTFIGQSARLFEQGETGVMLPISDAEFTSYAIAEGQRFQDSYEIIALFRKSYESFNNLKAPRIACYCSNRMAREYFNSKDYTNAKQLFDGVSELYRQEGWVSLLWESLGYLRECASKLGLPKEFVEYSLEMAALPIFSNDEEESPEQKNDSILAGPATLLQRERIQEEVFSIFKGNVVSCSFIVAVDRPISLEVDPISPLRAVLLASVAFHDQSVKPGTSTYITLSLLSQLPCPVELDQMEIQFNQSSCNFTINNANEISSLKCAVEDQGVRAETAQSLQLTTNKWLRFTFEIKSGQSGKLECLSVTIKIGNCLICCRAESPASMEDLPLWKFEDRMETFPTKDPGLTFSGQKFIQIEEPELQVDLILSACGPALVGETFIIPVSVVSKGHAVHSGELKINIVDAIGGGLLMSPRVEQSYSSDNHHVELLSISGTSEEDEPQTSLDSIKRIQQSFGVISIPVLGVGETWFSKLEIRWHRPKSVMLYVSLGYSPTSADTVSFQRVNVHRSLQIEGKVPIIVSQRFLMPFRREPMLLSTIKSSPDSDEKASLALNETSILIVSARNCTEVPLRLESVNIGADGDEDVGRSFSVCHNDGTAANSALLGPNEEFKKVFSVTPHVISPNIGVGTVFVKWKRDSVPDQHPGSCVLTKQKLPDVKVEKPPLVVSFECPPHAILGVPFPFHVRVQNLTSLLQEIRYSLGDSQSFVFSGPHNDTAFVLPRTEHIISYKLVPLGSGPQQIPRITITSVRYSVALNPSDAATTVFVYPSEPNFKINEIRQLEAVSSV